MNEIFFLLFKRNLSKDNWLTDLGLSLPVFFLITLLSFFTLSYIGRISINIEVITIASIVLALTTYFRLARQDLSIKYSEQGFDIESFLFFVLALSFYFIVLYRFIYLAGPEEFFFGDDASYISNIWSYFWGFGENFTYPPSSLFTFSSGFVYFSGSFSGSSWIMFLIKGNENPILFFVIINAFYSAIFMGIFYSIYLKKIQTIWLRISGAIMLFSGTSIVGILIAAHFSSTTLPFSGTPFPLFSPLIFIKGISTELYLKGAWQGPGFISFIGFLYIYTEYKENNRKFLLLLFVLCTLFLYLPLGIIVLFIFIFVKLGEFINISKLVHWALYSTSPAIVIWLLSYEGLLPHEIVGFVFYNVSGIISNFDSIFIFCGIPILVYLALRYFNIDASQINHKSINSKREIFLFVLIIFASAILVSEYSELLPSLVGENYILGFILSISTLIVILKYLIKLEKHLNRYRRIFIAGIIIMISTPTVFYAAEGNYYGPTNFQSIYITHDENLVANWLNKNDPNNSVFMAPLSLWYISPLSGKPVFASPYASKSSRANFINDFYSEPCLFNSTFNNQSSLVKWFSYPGDGYFALNNTIELNGNPVMQVYKTDYSEVSTFYSLSVQPALNLSFAVFPKSVNGSNALGISFNLSGSSSFQYIGFQSGGSSSSTYAAFNITLHPDAWNFITVNVYNALSKYFNSSTLTDLRINEINLMGGDSPVVYWGYIRLSLHEINLSTLVRTLSTNKIEFIIVCTKQQNIYITELLKSTRYVLSFKTEELVVYSNP